MKNKFHYLIFFISALIVSSFIKYFILSDTSAKPTIEINLSSSRQINQFELYINSLQKQPEIINNVNNDGRFTVSKRIDENVNFLRIDFGDEKNNNIKIYNIDIFYQDQNYKFDSNKLASWMKNDLEVKAINSEFIEFQSTGNDPFIYSSLNLKFENFNPN